MKIKDKLVVEHNMNCLIDNYAHRTYLNAENDIKLQFISFLLEFTQEEVNYGVEYILKECSGLYDLLYTLILDYQTYGLKNFEEPVEEPLEETPKTVWDKVKEFFQNWKLEINK